MKVEQIYTGCLAEAAYYISSNGEAVIIDPLRETEPYIKKAKEEGDTIKYILETHFHADFVSGHVDLAEKTGATIVYGPKAEPKYDVHVAEDGEILEVGDLKIKVLHTPGHTPESTTYLLYDEKGKEYGIFSGDTLFIGDVGRPDLAVKSDLTKEDLAGMLYDSLRQKIMPLPDDVIVYPAHGAGSACGKNMSSETTDTLGSQKETNYALRDISKEQFIQEVTEGIMPAPQYFAKNALMNKEGYQSIDKVMEQGVSPMKPEEVEAAAEHGALILDTRHQQTFNKAFIPNSINISLDGKFAVWVGTLVPDLQQPIVVIADEGREEEAVMRLARVGYDNTLGYLEGGIEAWQKAGKEIDMITSVSPDEFAAKVKEGDANILDVRRPDEYADEHVEGAQNLPLDFINDNMDQLERDKTYYVHCAGGYRSMTTCSILKARGFENLIDVDGGYGAIRNSDAPKAKGQETPA